MDKDTERRHLRRQLHKLERNQLLQERIFDRQHALLRKLNHDYENAMVTIAQQNQELARLAEERAQSLQEALQAKKEAEEANRCKGKFLAAMSHEIRTPLNVILGVCGLMLDDEDIAGTPARVRVMRDSARHLMGLLNNLLDYSRIAAGKVVLEELDFDLRDEMGSLIQAFALQAQAKGLDFGCSIAPELPQWFRGDACRLRQILLNLLDNAIKFTPDGSVTLGVRLLESDARRHVLRCDVQDSGEGIAEEDKAVIFETFTQAQGGASRLHGGVGLGLSICVHLAKLMGGDISVSSRKGRGSTFSLTVPLAPGAAPKHSAACLSQGKLRPLRLLLVDDHLPNAELVQEIARKAGHEVCHAADAEQALELLATQTFDAVLMDVELPGMSGIELTRRIRENEAETAAARLPVLGVTAHSLGDIHEQCRAVGMTEIHVKPVDYASVLQGLQAFLQKGGRLPIASAPAPFPSAYSERMARALDSSLHELQVHLQNGNCSQVKRQAHYLANTTAMVQAEDLTGMALELEKAAALSALPYARGIWTELKPRLQHLKQSLQAAGATSGR